MAITSSLLPTHRFVSLFLLTMATHPLFFSVSVTAWNSNFRHSFRCTPFTQVWLSSLGSSRSLSSSSGWDYHDELDNDKSNDQMKFDTPTLNSRSEPTSSGDKVIRYARTERRASRPRGYINHNNDNNINASMEQQQHHRSSYRERRSSGSNSLRRERSSYDKNGNSNSYYPYNNHNNHNSDGNNNFYDNSDKYKQRERFSNDRFYDKKYNNDEGEREKTKMNIALMARQGYQHLYGIAPVRNALRACRRDFSQPTHEDDVTEDFDASLSPSRPEAVVAPCLLIQNGLSTATKKIHHHSRSSSTTSKRETAAYEILSLAQEHNIPIVHVDKGILNTLCDNRPHQGFVLRCRPLDFVSIGNAGLGAPTKMPNLWLALDEVVDPQNLGALLRSAHFLGEVGVVVSAKNSSPLSPTVSAASAGALEVMTVYSTSNLPKLLNGAREDGWRVLGAAANVPDKSGAGSLFYEDNDSNDWNVGEEDESDSEEKRSKIISVEYATNIGTNTAPSFITQSQQQCYNLHEVQKGPPTILVLGSEGHGLRTLVARACTGFVRIPSGTKEEDATAVDSLNVSVTGGILLWHFFSKMA